MIKMNLQEMKEKEINNFRKDVINWAIEHTTEDLNDLCNYGCAYMGNVLTYNDELEEFYNKHDEEINEVIQNFLGISIWDAQNDEDAFNIVINNIGGIDSELNINESIELEQSELCYIVWFAFEIVASEILEKLESEC
jgi:hypothetical protein